MAIDWNEMRKEMYPIKDYSDLQKRWKDTFAYPFVCETYNFTIPEIEDYTQHLLGEDTRSRYMEYCQRLIETFNSLHHAGVRDILHLVSQIGTCEEVEIFIEKTPVEAKNLIAVLKYLIYWLIPTKKLLSALVDKDSPTKNAIQILRDLGIRTNLDILQEGRTPTAREVMANRNGLPETVIDELVNRADFSRMPWTSKATISNILGAGYESLVKLANANPEQLYNDFYRYGASIGKNLKLGNEIDNSYRIAKILPVILE